MEMSENLKKKGSEEIFHTLGNSLWKLQVRNSEGIYICIEILRKF